MSIKEIRSVQKVKVTIVAETEEERNAKYKMVRDEMYNQWQGLNLAMSLLATHNTLQRYNSGAENRLASQLKKLQANIDKQQGIIDNPKSNEAKITKAQQVIKDLNEEKEKLQQEFDDKKQYRTDIDAKFDEMYVKDIYQILTNQINFLSTETASCVVQKAKTDFGNSLTEYSRGETSLISYKRTNPLMLQGRSDSKYEKEDYRGGLHIYYEGDDIHIRWCKGIIFKVITGNNPTRNIDLKRVLHSMIKGEYRISQSELEFNNKGHLMMNICYRYNKEVKEDYIEGRTLGVDLGIAIPAYMCLSDNIYVRQGLGSYTDFKRVRDQFAKRRSQLQKSLVMVKGGKGRAKKLKAMEQFREKERNFAKTYNHQLSHKIVKFAKDNQCQYINLEKLTKEGFDNRLLASWSYYELQTMIKYKADREGIEVRFINPAYTSQTCSKCGHVHRDNRQTQSQFKCVECGFELNADHNASINIARSTEFVK